MELKRRGHDHILGLNHGLSLPHQEPPGPVQNLHHSQANLHPDPDHAQDPGPDQEADTVDQGPVPGQDLVAGGPVIPALARGHTLGHGHAVREEEEKVATDPGQEVDLLRTKSHHTTAGTMMAGITQYPHAVWECLV